MTPLPDLPPNLQEHWAASADDLRAIGEDEDAIAFAEFVARQPFACGVLLGNIENLVAEA